jgi:hypothetical protein
MADRNVIEATTRAFAAAWTARDRTSWLNTFAESATQEDPVGSRDDVGLITSVRASREKVPRTSHMTTSATGRGR